MKLIIDISEEDYRRGTVMASAIRNGTPLPKGHGRLLILDEGSVEKYMFPMSFSCQKWISEVGISNSVVTIIEADKEEKQNEKT